MQEPNQQESEAPSTSDKSILTGNLVITAIEQIASLAERMARAVAKVVHSQDFEEFLTHNPRLTLPASFINQAADATRRACTQLVFSIAVDLSSGFTLASNCTITVDQGSTSYVVNPSLVTSARSALLSLVTTGCNLAGDIRSTTKSLVESEQSFGNASEDTTDTTAFRTAIADGVISSLDHIILVAKCLDDVLGAATYGEARLAFFKLAALANIVALSAGHNGADPTAATNLAMSFNLATLSLESTSVAAWENALGILTALAEL